MELNLHLVHLWYHGGFAKITVSHGMLHLDILFRPIYKYHTEENAIKVHNRNYHPRKQSR
jgi:hypothetical protein